MSRRRRVKKAHSRHTRQMDVGVKMCDAVYPPHPRDQYAREFVREPCVERAGTEHHELLHWAPPNDKNWEPLEIHRAASGFGWTYDHGILVPYGFRKT